MRADVTDSAAGCGQPSRWSHARAAVVAIGVLLAAAVGSTAAVAGVTEQQREVEQRRKEVQQQVEEHRGELQETESSLRQQRDDLQDIEQELDVTVEDLQRLDRRIAELDEKLARLESDLAAAEAELAAAEQRLANTTSELVATEEELAETRQELAHKREAFAERSRASYVHGGSAAMLTQLLDASDVSQFTRSIRYMESVLAEDRERVERIAALARKVEATKRDLETLQQRRVAERAHAQSQRDKVAQLVEEQRQVRAEVAAEREQRRKTMLALQADRESHERLVASLRESSQEIEAELAALAQREEELSQREQELEQRRAAQREADEGASGGAAGGASGDGGSASAPDSGGQFQRPSQGRITSSFGYRVHPIHGTRRLHAGVDLAAGYGSPNFAAAAGEVVSAGWRGGYGRTVIVSHGGGLSTLYAHQSRLAVSPGQHVSRGQVVGYEGATGAVTGPHLHFEVRVNGQPRDPMPYLR